jgi:outer membrane protein assembly factor BamB
VYSWTVGGAGLGEAVLRGVGVSATQITIAGAFSGTASFGLPGTFSSYLGRDGFVAAFDLSDGKPRWRQRYGGFSDDLITSIAPTSDDSWAAVGSFLGMAGFGTAIVRPRIAAGVVFGIEEMGAQ